MARGRVTRWAVRVVVGLVVVLAVAVLAGYVAARRSVWRPGAGTVRLSGLKLPVEIAVDRFGVPHVAAQTVEDALFAQGYLHARERFFQMELTRRAAAGRLAELLGAAAVGFDADLRRWNLGPNVARQTAALDGEARAAVEAYARGVNAAIDRFGAAGLAPEFLLLGSAVDPWRVEDTVGVGLMMEMNLTWAADEERGRADLLKALGRERAVELWGWTAEQAAAWIPEDLPGAWSLKRAALPMAPLEGVGSNNWALAPSRTRTGRAIFANDPHIGVANPSTWYEVHLTAPGFAVTGASVPGAPGVLIGHNADVAWGFTMVMLDDQDVFRLRLDAAGKKELIAGEWRPLEVRREQVAVRGEREPREITVKVSAHGPVIQESADGALAMSWAALLGRSPLPAFMRLDRARSVEEAAAAFVDADAPGMNLLCADRAGHVRWQVIGRVPIRGRGAGRLPAPGWDPAWAWQGLAPYERNPTEADPPEGFVATANHDAFAEADFPREAEYPAEFAAPWRIRRIREELARRAEWDVADCLRLQMDDRNGQALAIVAALRPVLEGIATPAARALLAWDGRMGVESREATLWAEFLREASRRIGRDEATLGGLHRTPIGGEAVLRLAGGGLDPRWWDDVTTPAAETAREIVAASLEAAARRAGDAAWGERHRVPFAHPLGAVPLLGRLLNQGPAAAPGSNATLNANWYAGQGDNFDVTVIPSLRFVADVGEWDRSIFTLPLGQSGHFLSPHVADQLADWQTGRAHPMPWSTEAVRQAAAVSFSLEPADGGPR
jgi:penicillin G amidase